MQNMPRVDGRGSAQIRPTKLTRGLMPNAEGACLIEIGNTKVICTASVEEKLQVFDKYVVKSAGFPMQTKW